MPSAIRTTPGSSARSVRLRSGDEVMLRPIRPSDIDALERLFDRTSPDSSYLRFLSGGRPPHALVEHLAAASGPDRYAVVAEVDGEIVGEARFDRVGADAAECAVLVEDAWQGRGLGRVLLGHLTWVAAERGLRRFEALALDHNERILRMAAGVPGTVFTFGDGEVDMTIPIRAPGGTSAARTA